MFNVAPDQNKPFHAGETKFISDVYAEFSSDPAPKWWAAAQFGAMPASLMTFAIRS